MTVSDLSPDMLRLIALRIEASQTTEQIVYRETELDEVWRLADIALAGARAGSVHPAEIERLKTMADLVHAAHDLVGQNEDRVAAAAALRKAAVIAVPIRP